MRTAVFFSALFLVVSAYPTDEKTYPEAEGRAFFNTNVNPPRKFTDKALSKASACSDPSGFTGYCVASAACRAFNGTAGARCPKRPVGSGYCCLVGRCPVAPPMVPMNGAVATLPLPASGSPMGTQVQYICMPGLVFAGLDEAVVTSTCDARGNWSPEVLPGCVQAPPTECTDPVPSAPAGTLVSDAGNRTIGALVFYICTEGTFPDGREMTAALCTADGTWSPPIIPECQLAPPTSCAANPPSAPARVTQHYDGDPAIGATAVYVCRRPGEVFPNGSTFLLVTCAEDGLWEPAEVPPCATPPTPAP